MTIILGGGITGLAAGIASGGKVYEEKATPGGLCSSYYINMPGSTDKFRFEVGGGHWIFCNSPIVRRFLIDTTKMRTYSRRASVFFPDTKKYIPYPIQNNLMYFDKATTTKILNEILNPSKTNKPEYLNQWYEQRFGKTLTDIFFEPFHTLYTAGLNKVIAPQDSYKTPIDINAIVNGAFIRNEMVGYNTSFMYPIDGLDDFCKKMAHRVNIDYNKKVIEINKHKKEIVFDSGEIVQYHKLISTLPLNTMMKLTNLSTDCEPDPCTSVLVLNIGAEIGASCPKDHWLYIPSSKSGFHRIGFYSNVDKSFLPNSNRNYVSIYVEKAYQFGEKPNKSEIELYKAMVENELIEYGFIKRLVVCDPSWVDVGYTWNFPGNSWKTDTLDLLSKYDIWQVGRYGRWVFQGIAESIQDGFIYGQALR